MDVKSSLIEERGITGTTTASGVGKRDRVDDNPDAATNHPRESLDVNGDNHISSPNNVKTDANRLIIPPPLAFDTMSEQEKDKDSSGLGIGDDETTPNESVPYPRSDATKDAAPRGPTATAESSQVQQPSSPPKPTPSPPNAAVPPASVVPQSDVQRLHTTARGPVFPANPPVTADLQRSIVPQPSIESREHQTEAERLKQAHEKDAQTLAKIGAPNSQTAVSATTSRLSSPPREEIPMTSSSALPFDGPVPNRPVDASAVSYPHAAARDNDKLGNTIPHLGFTAARKEAIGSDNRLHHMNKRRKMLATKTIRSMNKVTPRTNSAPHSVQQGATKHDPKATSQVPTTTEPNITTQNVAKMPHPKPTVAISSASDPNITTQQSAEGCDKQAISGIPKVKVTATMTYEGPPTRPAPVPGGWPVGWIERRYKRISGYTKDREDSYFFPPTEKMYKLRSIKEVQRFLFAYSEKEDAEYAFQQRKNTDILK